MMVPTQVAHLARQDLRHPKTLRPWDPEPRRVTHQRRMMKNGCGQYGQQLVDVEICWVSNVFLWVFVIVCSKLIGLGHLNLGFRWCQARSVGKTWLVRNVGQIVKKYVIQQVLELDLWNLVNASEICEAQNLENTCRFLLISVDFGTLGTLHVLPGSPRFSLSADPGVSQQPMGQRVIKACRGEQIWMSFQSFIENKINVVMLSWKWWTNVKGQIILNQSPGFSLFLMCSEFVAGFASCLEFLQQADAPAETFQEARILWLQNQFSHASPFFTIFP